MEFCGIPKSSQFWLLFDVLDSYRSHFASTDLGPVDEAVNKRLLSPLRRRALRRFLDAFIFSPFGSVIIYEMLATPYVKSRYTNAQQGRVTKRRGKRNIRATKNVLRSRKSSYQLHLSSVSKVRSIDRLPSTINTPLKHV